MIHANVSNVEAAQTIPSLRNNFIYHLGQYDPRVKNHFLQDKVASSVEEGMNPAPVTPLEGLKEATNPFRPDARGFFGAMGKGFNDAFAGREGYTSSDGFFPGKMKAPYAREVEWTVPPQYGYSGVEENAYRLGRLAGATVGNAYRSKIWNAHPADLMSTFGQGLAFEQGRGQRFPMPKTFQNPGSFGDETRYKGTREAAALATLTGTLGVEGMLIGSGIYNPLNLTEGMRPAGYQAVNPSEEDPRVSTNPAMDVLQRYLFGRKGKLLPWEEFTQEKPNVSYEKYQEYKDWRFGEGNDPVRDLTMGLAQFTPSNLEGIPELSIMGVGVTPMGALASAGGLMAGNLLHSTLAKRSLEEYKNLQPKVFDGTATPQERQKVANNPFARYDNFLNHKRWIGEQVEREMIFDYEEALLADERKGYVKEVRDALGKERELAQKAWLEKNRAAREARRAAEAAELARRAGQIL
jgi:hypothetical protein